MAIWIFHIQSGGFQFACIIIIIIITIQSLDFLQTISIGRECNEWIRKMHKKRMKKKKRENLYSFWMDNSPSVRSLFHSSFFFFYYYCQHCWFKLHYMRQDAWQLFSSQNNCLWIYMYDTRKPCNRMCCEHGGAIIENKIHTYTNKSREKKAWRLPPLDLEWEKGWKKNRCWFAKAIKLIRLWKTFGSI